jgi:hypothetical protein
MAVEGARSQNALWRRGRRTKDSRAILVVSDEEDAHVLPVVREIRRFGKTAVVFDSASIPGATKVIVGTDGRGQWRVQLQPEGRKPIVPESVSSVWWRRPKPYQLGLQANGPDPVFVMAQIHEAVIGFWSAIEGPWINDPWRDQVAAHKLRQLPIAHDLGLEIPRTLVTTSGKEVQAFLNQSSDARHVRKLLAPTHQDWSTKEIGKADAASIASLSGGAAIIQEYVPGVDVRVTNVGDALFATEIDARNTISPYDFRPVFDRCRVSVARLSTREEWAVREMRTRLGLVYAAFDFRRTKDGRLVFLEVNPAGQWLFIQNRTGQPIAEAIARVLCRTGEPGAERTPRPGRTPAVAVHEPGAVQPSLNKPMRAEWLSRIAVTPRESMSGRPP